jgi:hypothetical protein
VALQRVPGYRRNFDRMLKILARIEVTRYGSVVKKRYALRSTCMLPPSVVMVNC